MLGRIQPVRSLPFFKQEQDQNIKAEGCANSYGYITSSRSSCSLVWGEKRSCLKIWTREFCELDRETQMIL